MDSTRTPTVDTEPYAAEKGQNGPSDAMNPASASPRPPEALTGPQEAPVAVRPPLPSREQVEHLLARAERRVLTPVEAQQLRQAVTHLLGLVEALPAQAWRANRELRRQLEAARSERDAARREAAQSSPTLVACPYCKAAAGSRCVSVKGTLPPRTPHTARLDAASRWLFRQELGEAS